VAHFLPSALFSHQKCTKWQSEIFASLRNREWRERRNWRGIIIIIIINKVLIKVTLNKVIAGALYIVICG